MMQVLKPEDLTVNDRLATLSFESTADLLDKTKSSATEYAWQLQSEAKKTLMLGLAMRQSACNVLVLGAQGSGRTMLALAAMRESANAQIHQTLCDWVAVHDFKQSHQASYIKLPVGMANAFRTVMEHFLKLLVAEMPSWVEVRSDKTQVNLEAAQAWLDDKANGLRDQLSTPKLSAFIHAIPTEMMAYLQAWQGMPVVEGEHPSEGIVNDAFLARFRVNVLVDHRASQQQGHKQAVVVESDPGYGSLFGYLEVAPTGESSHMPEFLRLRAGSLHQADGGTLLLHLRDFMQDETNGAALLERLYRFMRNGELQIEDWQVATQHGSNGNRNGMMPLQVKLVMIATREDFYDCLEAQPDFFDYFPIKVEFEERVDADTANYHLFAGYIAQQCEQLRLPHFTAKAVAGLMQAMHRLEEDQTRLSTHFSYLEQLMHESISFAQQADLVTDKHVNAALSARLLRQQFFETQIRDSIIDNELLIQVQGDVTGQVNGLTHIELGDASFGSPIRITARCYPGKSGLINIDREVNMSGPNHDKGIYILQNWLSASFWALAPLSLNASLVFEQEYNGVEGDSASCAELFALLSALTGLPLKQGTAVTGALNQFGEVMPIGGVNEKIEGYFRVCQALGLTGEQGVMIPKRNLRHLVLTQEVVDAVANGQFHIIAIDHVLEGISYLTGVDAGLQDTQGEYSADSVMGQAQATLASYRHTLERNQARMAYMEHQQPDLFKAKI